MLKLRFTRFASALVAACFLLQPGTATPEKPVRRVLIFYELGVSSPAVALVDREIRAALGQTPYQVELYAEYLETALFPDAASQQKFREWYILKYKKLKPDVILAVGPSPLKFMVESHEKFFRDIPVVFCATTPEQAGNPKLNSNFAGVWINFDPAKTLEVALQLQPSTQHVVVVGGSGATDRLLVGIVRGALRRYEEKVEITYLIDQTMSTFLDRLKRLPPHTIIFYTLIRQDATGEHFIPATQSVPMITAVANAPVVVNSDSLVGTGAVGGYVNSYAAQGQIVSRIATRILAGERPQDIATETESNVYMFDWSALRRWGLRESGVPPGSIVINRQRGLWESYKYYIIVGILLCVIETLLILGLLWQRTNRKKFELSLIDRMAFEKMLSDLSRTFINLPEEQVGATIQASLGRIAEFLKLTRITLFEYSQENREFTVAFSWCAKGIENPPAVMGISELPWWNDRLLGGDSILLSDLNSIPEEASVERDHLRRMGAVSVATIPLKAGEEFFGCISYVSTKRRVLQVQAHQKIKPYQQLRYWSNVPFRHGPNDVVKQSATPLSDNPARPLERNNPNALQDELARHLKEDGKMSGFDFGLQFLDADRMTYWGQRRDASFWTENASLEWKETEAPFHTVGRLTLLASSQLTKDAAEAAYFDVTGHSTPDSMPVGSINRARWRGEVASRNARTRVEEKVAAVASSGS